jgi:integrase
MLWIALYLTRPEIEEFLLYLRRYSTLPWVYPMMAFAAYTGARRSEMLRALATDVDLASGMLILREKKRVKGRQSHRTAPITPRLAEAIREGRFDTQHVSGVKVYRVVDEPEKAVYIKGQAKDGKWAELKTTVVET